MWLWENILIHSVRFTENSNGEMRSSVTPTTSKLKGGAKRAHKTVCFDIGRVYVRGQVCVCNISLAYKSASFRYFRVSIKIRMCVAYVHVFVYVLMHKRTFDWLGGFKLSSFDCFTFSRASTFY